MRRLLLSPETKKLIGEAADVRLWVGFVQRLLFALECIQFIPASA